MILLIDNYDSFTYNIYQYIKEEGYEVTVLRNDAFTLQDIDSMAPTAIILSPGPGRPEQAGLCLPLIHHCAGRIPLLGICLGMQCIGAAFECPIIQTDRLFHGKNSNIFHDSKGLFSGLPNPFSATRYHSLAIDKEQLSSEIEITATSDDGIIMGIQHRRYSISGVQFHPESIGTEHGKTILTNFLTDKLEQKAIVTALKALHNGQTLSLQEARHVMDEIASESATPAQIAAFLTAMDTRCVTREELTGFAGAMRDKAVPVRKPPNKTVIDTCGTGGDGQFTFNISTLAAFIAAGAGLCVAKHGNRSVTSKCGSADLLERLGVQLNIPIDKIERSLEEVGLAFLFAPALHPSMKYAASVRREIGIPTIFNILGPLTNPARADVQIIGIFRKDLQQTVAQSLHELGIKRGLVIHGDDGMDEITLSGKTHLIEVKDGWIRPSICDPASLGFSYASHNEIRGGSLNENAEIAYAILKGQKGAKRNIVVLNAAAALYAGNAAASLQDGVHLAEDILDSGKAFQKLTQLVEYSHD
jgi:anthranilate phosphoribosyltransferase